MYSIGKLLNLFHSLLKLFLVFMLQQKRGRQVGRCSKTSRLQKTEREREEIETGRSTKGNVRHGLEAQKGTK